MDGYHMLKAHSVTMDKEEGLLEFDWILLSMEYGHYEMNMVMFIRYANYCAEFKVFLWFMQKIIKQMETLTPKYKL